ncbi:MAG: DUF1819 family protein [Chloroflexi bacterium]|nr:DUF1819 family protein [Chloroflexota bacterium]
MMLIPDVGKRQAEYTIGLSKSASAIDELRLLLEMWQPGEDVHNFLIRVREAGVLGKQTAQRTSDIVLRVFRVRLLQPNELPARWLQQVWQQQREVRLLRELLFLYTARADAFLYDFTIEAYWPRHHAGNLYLTLDDVYHFIRNAYANGLIPAPGLPRHKRKSRGAFWGAARFRFAARRTTSAAGNYHLPRRRFHGGLPGLRLHLAGLSNGRLVEHPDWRLFGLDRPRALARLAELDQRRSHCPARRFRR